MAVTISFGKIIYIPDIGLAVRVFANGPGRVIPKTQKMVLDSFLLNTQYYKVWIKWSNPGKGVAPSPTLWCSSYRKGSLRVTLDYGRQLFIYEKYLFYMYLGIWNQMPWRNLQIKVLHRNLLHLLICNSTNLRSCGSIFPKTDLIFLRTFST